MVYSNSSSNIFSKNVSDVKLKFNSVSPKYIMINLIILSHFEILPFKKNCTYVKSSARKLLMLVLVLWVVSFSLHPKQVKQIEKPTKPEMHTCKSLVT